MADDQTGNWTPTPLFAWIDGVTPNDGAPILSGTNPQGDALGVKLAALAVPCAGAEALTVRMSGDGATPVAVALLQGSQIIAANIFTPTAGFQDYTLTLTAAQVAQITDWTDLHVEVIAGEPTVSCCPNPLPAVLYATFSGGTGTCACLNGATVPLGYNSAADTWQGHAPGCGGNISLSLHCAGGHWSLTQTSSCNGVASYLSSSCSPLSVTFSTVMGPMSCCTGTATITVTP
jgi:hypothetical protein